MSIKVTKDEKLEIKDSSGSVKLDNWLIEDPKLVANKYFRYCVNNNKLILGDTTGSVYDSELRDFIKVLRKYTAIAPLESKVSEYELIKTKDNKQIKFLTDALINLADFVLNTYLQDLGKDISNVSESDKVKLKSEMVSVILSGAFKFSDSLQIKSNPTFEMKKMLDKSDLLEERLKEVIDIKEEDLRPYLENYLPNSFMEESSLEECLEEYRRLFMDNKEASISEIIKDLTESW